MKNIKNIKWVLLLFFAVIGIQSCEKDNYIEPLTAATSGNTTDGNTSGTTGANTGNTGSTIKTDVVGEEGDITLYRIEGTNLVKDSDYKVDGSDLKYQKDTAKHDEVWALVKKIIPASQISKLSDFLIFSGTSNGTAGFVTQTTKDLSKWKMGIAIDFCV